MGTNFIRNIALLAHVDAGKTTLSEQFLYRSGSTRTLGSVDKGTTISDALSIEKSRGISVRSALIGFQWNEFKINLIDSPGHADFVSEVEKALLAADGVVLLISAAEGVQAQSAVLWEFLQEYKIPTLLFINKCDRPGVDPDALMEELQKEFGSNLITLNRVENPGSEKLEVKTEYETKHPFVHGSSQMELIVEHNDQLMEAYLSGDEIRTDQLKKELIRLCQSAKLSPVLWGSTKTGCGTEELLNAIITYLPPPSVYNEVEANSIIYKTLFEPGKGLAAFVRVFSGTLKVKDEVLINNEQKQKINTLQRNEAGKFKDDTILKTGEVGKIYGFQNVRPGDFIGKIAKRRFQKSLSHALLNAKIEPANPKDFSALTEALQILNNENPDLNFTWFREDQELQLNLNGWIQQETITAEILERFSINVNFEKPMVIYKERPSGKYTAYDEYTMPKPCWAVVHFEIEPLTPGSGVQYQSLVSFDKIERKYQNEIEHCIQNTLSQGQKGWEVSDIKIILTDGEDHEVHSRPGDFIIATNIALQKAFAKYGTELMEPILAFKLMAPADMLGQVAADMHKMRGTFEAPEMNGTHFLMKGLLPLATSLEYPVQLTSRSGGKARIVSSFHSYRPCADEEGIIRPFRGVNPADRSKYILKMRGALQ